MYGPSRRTGLVGAPRRRFLNHDHICQFRARSGRRPGPGALAGGRRGRPRRPSDGRRPRWLRPLVGRLMARFPDGRPTIARVAGFLVIDEKLRRLWAREPFGLECRPRPSPLMPRRRARLRRGRSRRSRRRSSWPTGWNSSRPSSTGSPTARGSSGGPRRARSAITVSLAAEAQRLDPADRGPRPAAQSDPAADARRGPGADPAPRRGARVPARPVGPDVRRGPRRAGRRPQAGPPRLLPFDRRGAGASPCSAPPATPRPWPGSWPGSAPTGSRSSLWRRPDAPGPAPTPGGPASSTGGRICRRGRRPRRLANLGAYRLDCRLAGLAASAGATYTRYADDLAFSGDGAFARSADRFLAGAGAIAIEEGFAVQHRKTRVMRRGRPPESRRGRLERPPKYRPGRPRRPQGDPPQLP